tara:strand:+ start:40 stop:1338 length:1299 start_codon:yes stop_codon:yes gene_type:complete
MNVFRRPMFRGGKVDSRGTGITSGLSYAKGGRVGLQFGGSPFGAPIPQGSALNPPTSKTYSRPIGPPRGGLSGGTLGSRLLSKSKNLPFVGKAMRPLFGGLGGGATLATGGAGLFGVGALGGIGIGQLADFYARGSSTPEGYARLKEMGGPNFNFDETNIDVGEVFKYIDEGNQMGEKYGFFPRGGKAKRLEEMGLADQFTPEGDRIELPEVLEKLTENNENNQDRPGDGKAGNKETTTDIKDAIREDKELFAELLGAKKARGQDIADMLLSFSSKALAPEADVKSAFAEFAADEVKRPSRVRKIDDSAAALAINAYIAGEKSKADLDRALKATEGKLDLEQDLLKRRSLTSRINQDRTGRTVKQIVVGNTKEWMSDNNLSGVPNLVSKKDIEDPKLLVQENVGEVFINEDTKEVFLMVQDAEGNISLKQYY